MPPGYYNFHGLVVAPEAVQKVIIGSSLCGSTINLKGENDTDHFTEELLLNMLAQDGMHANRL